MVGSPGNGLQNGGGLLTLGHSGEDRPGFAPGSLFSGASNTRAAGHQRTVVTRDEFTADAEDRQAGLSGLV